MKLRDILLNENEEDGYHLPDEAVPHKSTNAPGTIPLSHFTNDWGGHKNFKDVDFLMMVADQRLDTARVVKVPLHKARATQYWIEQDQVGYGDPVFPELDDKKELPVAFLLKDGMFHFVDGHHRLDRAMRKSLPTIDSWVINLSDKA